MALPTVSARVPTRSGPLSPAWYEVVDAAVVWFAGWTLVYHLALVAGGLLASTVWLTVAGIALAAGVSVLTVRTRRSSTGAGPDAPIPLPVGLTALAAALLSLIANRPDADDVFYVNRSSAVAASGVVPMRDTVFSHQVFGMIPGQYPPVASFEALIGCIARATGMTTEFLTYFVLPPVGSVLAVLALWRLLTCWNVRFPLPAFAVAVTYLLFGGQFHASFGNTWIERMWQGKIVFVSALIPLLLVYLVRAARGGRPELLMIWAGAITGIGLTSAGIYVTGGFFVAAAAAAALQRRPRREWLRLLAPAGYVLVMGLIWQVAAERNQAGLLVDSRPTSRVIAPAAGEAVSAWGPGADIVTKVLGTGPYLVVGLVAVAVGWTAIQRPFARLMTLLTVIMVAFLVSPLGTAMMELVSLPDAIRWRVIWLLPVPALLGALVSGAMSLRGRLGPAAVVAAALVVVAVGLPIWSAANRTTLGVPTAKWPDAARAGYAELQPVVQPGDIVGTTDSVGGMLTSLSGDAWSVNPRPNYTLGMAAEPGFCPGQRLMVSEYASGSRLLRDGVLAALDDVGVAVLQLDNDPSADDLAQLQQLGFAPAGAPDLLRRDQGLAEQSKRVAGLCR